MNPNKLSIVGSFTSKRYKFHICYEENLSMAWGKPQQME